MLPLFAASQANSLHWSGQYQQAKAPTATAASPNVSSGVMFVSDWFLAEDCAAKDSFVCAGGDDCLTATSFFGSKAYFANSGKDTFFSDATE